jgi:hypothetical protein
VREVQPGDIESRANQLAEDLGSAAGGAQGSDNLGAAGTFGSGNERKVRDWIQRSIHEIALPHSFYLR